MSLLLFLVLWSGSIGAIGFAQAEEQAFPGVRVPVAGFALPERRVGDLWSYRVHTDSTWMRFAYTEAQQADGSTAWYINHSWAAPRPMVDADGVVHDTNVFVSTAGGGAAEWHHHIDVQTRRLVSFGLKQTHTDSYPDSWINVVDVASTLRGYGQIPVSGPASIPVCLDAAYWSGTLQRSDVLRLPPCWTPRGDSITEQAFQPTAAYQVEGKRYIVLDRQSQEQPVGLNMGIERLVFREDVPYPVEVHYVYAGKLEARHVLAFFQAGDGPLSDQGRTPVSLPPLQFSDPTWHGIPDAAANHPFRFSDAMAAARDDPAEPAVRQFLARNPDAVVTSASHATFEGDAGTTHGWRFDLAARREVLGPCTIHKTGAADPGFLALPVVSQGGATTGVSCEAPKPAEGNLTPHPPRAPTASSMLKAWTAYAAALDLPTETAGYWLRAPDPNGTEPYWFGVGFASTEEPESALLLAAVQPSEFTRRGEMVWFDPDGRIVGVTGWRDQEVRSPALVPGPDASAVDPATPSTVPVVWTLPDGEWFAKASVLTLLIAIVYWLWPWMKKLLVLGLFSRIHRNAALDHKVRALILAAIEQEPGIHDRELGRRVDVARGALQHHLRKLGEHDLVVRRRDGGFTRYWPPGAMDHAPPLDGTAQAVRDLLTGDPTLTQAEVARRLGVSRQAVGKHVARLRAAGMLPRV